MFFSCGGKDGTYMIASSARRQLRMNNSILLLRIPGIGVLMHPKHPDTAFFTSNITGWPSTSETIFCYKKLRIPPLLPSSYTHSVRFPPAQAA